MIKTFADKQGNKLHRLTDDREGQRALDLWEANQVLKSEVAGIRPLNAA